MSSHKYPRVLFVLKKQGIYNGNDYSTTPVYSSGLGNSARFVVDMLKDIGVPTDVAYVIDNNGIHKQIVEYKADVVIIEAFWVVPEKFDELKKACPKVTFIIRNHSETPFLAQEGMAFGWIMKYLNKSNVLLGCNSTRMLEDTRFLAFAQDPTLSDREIERKTVLLPNYYPTTDAKRASAIHHSEFLDISCFGAVRPLKNHMIQAMAAMKAATRMGKRLRFHINGGRVEQKGEPILKNLKELFAAFPQHELINHGWLAHDEFKELASTMDIAMQVSLSETFNIVAADTVTLGIPTITSPEVRWASGCFQANPTDSNEIAKMVEKAYNFRRSWPSYNPSLKGLKSFNKMSIKEWSDVLLKLKGR
jgi:hypothetical protein